MLDLLTRRRLAAALLSVSLVAPALAADAPAKAPEKPATAAPAAPAAPAKKDAADVGSIKIGRGKDGKSDEGKGFLARHEGFLKDLKAKEGKVDLLLVGDSITDGWRGGGKDAIKGWTDKMSVYNIGIGGDRTQHVIWRLDNGEVEGISPKVAMLMIGTNNLGGNTNDEIVAGITKIVQQLNTKLPNTKVLLLGIFPRAEKADAPQRARIKEINEKIAKLDDGGKKVKYLDIGQKFLAADGTLTKDIMPDALHPNAKGYQIWAEAVTPTIQELMK
ncbi:MAG TPA: GDSL-type esterase/lipase family protein [Humisphaera sp.]